MHDIFHIYQDNKLLLTLYLCFGVPKHNYRNVGLALNEKKNKDNV